MADAPTLPPDQGTPYRVMVHRWLCLWHARYTYPETSNDLYGRVAADTADAAPGYTRSFSQLVAGLFQRQPPSYEPEPSTEPIPAVELSELLAEMVAKAAGQACVLLRPVFDGVAWRVSVLAPNRFAVKWAHRRPVEIVVWDYAKDPRASDDKRGLAIVETWTPGVDGEAGMVVTSVWETEADRANGGMKLTDRIDIQNPPEELAEHPYIISAENDAVARDLVPYVWAWEDFGPASLWYTNENVIDGLARLWDQEQDDAEMTRKRVAMPEDAMGRKTVYADGSTDVIARPGFNKQDNILLLTSGMSAEHGPNGGVTPIEFGDDLTQRDRIERRENALLEAVGINPASIGRNVGGRSDSGVAKRADNQMTMNTITAPARRAEAVLTRTVREIGRLNGAAVPDLEVSVHEGLKENPIESAEVAVKLRDAEAASTRTLVQTAHPTWSDDEVDAEVGLMESQGAALAPFEE